MHEIIIAHGHIERCPQQQVQFVYFWRLLLGGHAITDGPNMFISQAGKAFAVNFELYAAGTFPAYCSTQDTTPYIEHTLVGQDFTSFHMEALTINEQFDRKPVRGISQFLFAYGNIIENAVEQGCRVGSKIVLFKGTACGKITIANSI